VLTVAERNRIYAVTNKNRIIVSCLGAITTSQFILGLCLITYIAMDGGEPFVTKCGPESLHALMFQRNRSCGSHFRFIWCALSRDIGPWRSDLPPCLLHTVRNSSCQGDTRPDHFTDFLTFSVIVYLVVQSNVKKVQLPRLLRAIAQSATHHFLIIFSSHLALELTLLLARVRVFSQ